jgi:hypothetical protein
MKRFSLLVIIALITVIAISVSDKFFLSGQCECLDLMCPTWECFEIFGRMGCKSVSPVLPGHCFYLHNCNVEYILEGWTGQKTSCWCSMRCKQQCTVI